MQTSPRPRQQPETANEIVYGETEPRPISQSHKKKKKKKEVLEEHNESGQLWTGKNTGAPPVLSQHPSSLRWAVTPPGWERLMFFFWLESVLVSDASGRFGFVLLWASHSFTSSWCFKRLLSTLTCQIQSIKTLELTSGTLNFCWWGNNQGKHLDALKRREDCGLVRRRTITSFCSQNHSHHENETAIPIIPDVWHQ